MLFLSRQGNISVLLQCCRRRNFTWVTPDGRETGVCLYNPVAKKKVPLTYENKKYLTWYSCGPTVYDATHIGHASSYVRLDIMRRVLSHWFGVQPVVALGITDIDDKIIEKSKQMQMDYSEVAKKYELEFFRDMDRFHILSPHFVLRVTEHISEIIDFVSSLIKKGHAYSLNDGSVYFNTQSLPSYGKVSRAPVIEPSAPREGQRLHPADFALWKASKPGEPSWPSPWARGRPGWHIECSAMASKIFGQQVDVHSGGLDLLFPHHENEEAQSCAFHSVDQWVNYWVHTGHLLMNGMKMSKSMKNFITVEKFLEEYSADSFRMVCLMTHYRLSIDYTPDVMKKAVALVDKLTAFLGNARSYQRGSWELGNFSSAELLELLETTKNEVKECLADDINTAQSVNKVEELVKAGNAMLHADPKEGASREVAAVAAVADFVQQFLQSLGMLQSQGEGSDMNSSDFVIDKAVKFRNEIREIAMSQKDKSTRNELLKACDTLRADLKSTSIIINDTSKTTSGWSRGSH